ncbi:hypothetical protein [Paraburkholderia susongensis]|uniref:hypothetical protein n=1 Tax=Paraburkholderia susongensis TaxID=1515439 RepID=UPI000A1C8D35|nr:hypothetical protein [Paraburkholderia susongensis]
MDALNRGGHMALIKVHGEILLRAPSACWQDGGWERERGRPAGQAANLFKDRLLQVSKASAPFVKIFKF